MVSTGAGLIISLLFVGALYTTEAAITGWSNPTSTNGAATPTIPEDTAVGTTGVTIVANASGSITYAIGTQPTAGKLTIDTSSGLLSLAAAKSFDFETEPTYVLTVIATDGGATDTATVTLSITNVNEAPTFATAQTSATVSNASTGGTSVTTVSASDVDKDDSVTYTISGGNTNNDFAIDGTTGAITVAPGKTLAAGTSYTLTVTATDKGSLTGTTTASITVKAVGVKGAGTGTDTGTAPIVKESDPVFSASYSPCIADKSPAGTTLTTVTATVKDTSDTFTYAIASGNTGDVFKIDATGLIKVDDAKTLDKATTAKYALVVTAADTVVTTKTGTTTVSVTVADSCDSGTAVVAVSVMMLIVSLLITLF